MTLNIHQKISFTVVIAIVMISMYDAVFHFLLWLLHILFESAEFVLDHFIEGVFEIGNRETEIVVFYLLISLISVGVYRLYHALPRWQQQFKQLLQRQQAEALAQWQALSALYKMAWWSFFLTAINCWLFLT